MSRNWLALPGYDVDCGQDAAFAAADNCEAIEDCRRFAETNGLGGFVVFDGEAFFRGDSAESLLQKRKIAAQAHQSFDDRVTLHVGLAVSTALPEKKACLGCVGSSLGMWLEESDFVFSFADTHRVGFGDQDTNIIGSHGVPRNWPDVWSKSPALKKLLKKSGPLATQRAGRVMCPGDEYNLLVDDVDLLPLQSFANAMSIEAALDLPVVEGWAVFDLFDFKSGTAYMAERYWWNALPESGEWVDFTPRPEGCEWLLLASSTSTEQRQEKRLTPRHESIAERLLHWRSPFAQSLAPAAAKQEQSLKRPLEQPLGQPLKQPPEEPLERPQEQPLDQLLEQPLEQPLEQLDVKSTFQGEDTDGALPKSEADEATDACAKDAASQQLQNLAMAPESEMPDAKLLVEDVKGNDAGAVERALAAADENDAVRMSLVEAGMCEALCAHLSTDSAETSALRLLVVLLECKSEADGHQHEPKLLVSASAVSMLVKQLSDEHLQVASDAALVLAWAVQGDSHARRAARDTQAAPALARLFRREDAAEGSTTDVARAMWHAPVEDVVRLAQATLDKRKSTSVVPDKTHWEELRKTCYEDLQEKHAATSARERRAHSWGRTLAFSQTALGMQGAQAHLRRGNAEEPFVIWVLGAVDQVEAELAASGFFDDANWIDRAPTEVILFGNDLRQLNSSNSLQEGQPTVVRTASYDALPFLSQLGAAPDFVAVLMPPIKHGAGDMSSFPVIPDEAVAALPQVPVVISTRFAIGEGGGLTIRHRLQGQVLLPPTRCPFSAAAGKPNFLYDDNGWIFVVKDPAAMAKALQLKLGPDDTPPPKEGTPKSPAIFWGILDIKYDTSQPVLERVKVLETGDGKSSKFSGDGAAILHSFHERYRVEEDPDLKMDQILAADKKLMHDFMALAGYEHLVPQQVCFPREYKPDLADRIVKGLGLGRDDCVVLKLCNRSRAAGVMISRNTELDELLHQLLTPPEDPEAWLKEQLATSMALELGMHSGTFKEQLRHWWSNESPVFVAERWCRSLPIASEGKQFDGTLRVGFALRRQGGKRRHPLSCGGAGQESPSHAFLRSQQKAPAHPNSVSAKPSSIRTRPMEHECGHCKQVSIHGQNGFPNTPFANIWYCNDCWKQWQCKGGQIPAKEATSTAETQKSEVVRPPGSAKELLPGRRDHTQPMLPESPAKPPTSDEEESPVTPDQLEIDWLGGYWKLPKSHLDADADLRDIVVSAARTSGTAPVNLTHLFEIYAGLADSVQQLFGSAEPSSSELVERYHPELAAYLIARLGTTRMNRDLLTARRTVGEAQEMIEGLPDGPGKSCVVSFTKRAQGVMEAKMGGPERWPAIESLFQTSLSCLPTNANTLFCLGCGALQGGRPNEATSFFNRALLLDPDFKAPYVMLGAAYIRLKIWQLAIQFSEVCLGRHPESPQCDYHIAVASCQLALQVEAHQGDKAAFEKFQSRSLEHLQKARGSKEATRRVGGRTPASEWKQLESPWLAVDDQMVAAMESEGPQELPRTIELPATIGWPWYQYRM